MKISKRIISLFLVIAITIPVIVVTPVAAASGDSWGASGSGLITDTNSVVAWSAWMDANIITHADDIKPLFWNVIDKSLLSVGLGSCNSDRSLSQIGIKWNKYLSSDIMWKEQIGFCFSVWTNVLPSVSVDYDSDLGVYRLRESTTNLWLVNSSGHFPYYRPDSPDQEISYDYQWLRTNQINWNGGIAIVSYTELKEILALGYDGYIERRGNYLHIFDRSTDGTQILCSEEGFPLSAISNMSNTAVGTPNNYYTEEGDTINNYDQGDTVYNEFLDITNNTTWFPNGTLQYIDKVVYDESTKTYIVDSHDSYTYNSTTNNYVTNNYRYEYNYHIDYTSVTYIGTTEQYDEEYRYYYQLPDGRSSADLTAEDLEQLSIAFTDVVNYARSADDVNMRGLYHFDGNTQDSSYWSYCTDFIWNAGASLTYMDEGTFGGSLYLDETEHDFSIMLPGNDLSSDFTLQFRYYQSYTAEAKDDSYILLGNEKVFRFTGAKYYASSGSLCSTSIGTWNEICLMKKDSVLYYFINGVPYGSVSDNVYHSPYITFHFGSTQQTYKKLDEIRITKAAIYTPEVNYIPSSVPYDTNLSLVLPDSSIPVADEVLVVTPSENNMLDLLGLSNWTSPSVVDNLTVCDTVYNTGFAAYQELGLFYNSSYTFFSDQGASVSMHVESLNPTRELAENTQYYDRVAHESGLFLPIAMYTASGSTSLSRVPVKSYVLPEGTYTFSVVLSDGSSSSVTFKVESTLNCNQLESYMISTNKSSVISFDTAIFKAVNQSTYASQRMFGLFIVPDTLSVDVEIVYMELIEGSEAQFSISWDEAVYSSAQLEDSPVLAVRSNQTITGYQIGGVRPSYPAKGQVWAMVENGRITSLQQYTGSAWVEVDGRIWTGQRWIPYSSFDVFLLKDCYDIQGTVTGDDYEYIYSESGFWAWFQKQWLAFMAKIDAIIELLGGDPDSLPGGDSGDDEALTFMERLKKIFEDSLASLLESLLDLITKILDLVLGVIYDLLDYFFGLITDVVTEGIGNFFDALTDEILLQFFHTEEPLLDSNGQPVLDENGNPIMVSVVALPSGVAAVFAFISATIMLLPEELLLAIFFGLGVSFLLAVLNLTRS